MAIAGLPIMSTSKFALLNSSALRRRRQWLWRNRASFQDRHLAEDLGGLEDVEVFSNPLTIFISWTRPDWMR